MNAIGTKASELLASWKPDLVYTTDDNAQEYFVKKHLNAETPFVFSGVNNDPSSYGFDKSSNVTGVLEHEHFVQSVKLLREIQPSIRKIAIVADDDPAWQVVLERVRKKAEIQLPEIRITSIDTIKNFSAYKQKMRSYEKTADAVCIIAWFTFKDDSGNNVGEEDVAKWTFENSRVPDFSFWRDRVSKGTLCSVYVSAYEQGFDAGRRAYRILAEGASPSSLRPSPTVKGRPVINLSRAKKLGLHPSSSVLLNSEVIEKPLWSK